MCYCQSKVHKTSDQLYWFGYSYMDLLLQGETRQPMIHVVLQLRTYSYVCSSAWPVAELSLECLTWISYLFLILLHARSIAPVSPRLPHTCTKYWTLTILALRNILLTCLWGERFYYYLTTMLLHWTVIAVQCKYTIWGDYIWRNHSYGSRSFPFHP